jgi:hypothetical protein
MRTQIDTAWLPAVLAVGGLLGLAAAGGNIVWGIAASLVWTVCYGYFLTRKRSGMLRRTEMESAEPVCSDEMKDRIFLRAVSLHRHDLINDIQLLQGYAQLGKIDKVRECIDMMKNKAAQETVLFHLGIPRLVLFLYRFSAEQRHVSLELELEPELYLDKSIPCAETFADLVIDWIETLQRYGGADEMPFLSLEMFKQDGILHVFLEYEGSYDERSVRERYEQSARFIAGQWHGAAMDTEYSDRRLTARLQIPLAAEIQAEHGGAWG